MTREDREHISLALTALEQALRHLRSLEKPTREEREIVTGIERTLQSPRLQLRGMLYPDLLRP
jgi:hypothetical protein